MATLTPARLAAITQEPLDGESVVSALQLWQRRLALQQALRWTIRALIVGLLLACLPLLIARLTPWENAVSWAIAIAGTIVFITLGVALWKRPSLAGTARRVDSRLALHDRLSTAWELRTQATTLPTLQRRDALKQLQKYKPATTFSLLPRRSTGLSFVITVTLFVLLLVLPNPMTALLKQQSAFQARIAKQIASIDKVRQDLKQQSTVSPSEQQKIDQILQDLEKKLQQTKTDTQAQQTIAQAQAKLNQYLNPQAANNAQANAAASSALQNSNNANLKALGNALASGDSKQVSSALQNLADQVNKMSPAQRAQTAQQLENAANQASKNPALSTALHQLAKAVADGNQSEVADAANATQAAAAQNAATQAQNNNVNQAAQGLQQAANNLAASTDGTYNQNQSQQGQNQNQAQQGQGQAANQGHNQGQQGQNQAQGQGQGQGQNQGQQGQGQGQNQGQGQGQGLGQGTGNNGAGNNPGKTEQVTISGQTGTGSSTQSASNNTGVVQGSSSVPYAQVVQQYSQMAHDAIDNSNVSPDQKNLVQDYFNQLEGR